MAKIVKDPICSMMIESDTAAGSSVYEGETYYFCGAGCKKAFDEDPAKYSAKDHGRYDSDKHN